MSTSLRLLFRSLTIANAPSQVFFWAPPSSLLSVPVDVLYHILSWASPLDLQVLRLVCRRLQVYIDDPEHTTVWRTAFRNVMFDVPRPSPLTTFSYSTLPTLVFGGGKCMSCRRITPCVPYSFALGIRFCSMACEFNTLASIPSTPKKSPVLPSALPDLDHHTTLPAHLPYLEGSSALRLYAPAQVNAAWERFSRQFKNCPVIQVPVITPASPSTNPTMEHWVKTAEILCAGARRYRIVKEEVDTENEALLSELGQNLGYTLNQLISSPTLAHWVNLFARDLQTFTPLVWKSIQDTVLGELGQRASKDDAPISCSFCPAPPAGQLCRSFKSDEYLHMHIERRHVDQAAAPIGIRFERCPLCPKRKTAMYDRQSMIKHVSKRSVSFTCLDFLNPDERLATESKAGRGRHRAKFLPLVFLSTSLSFFSYSATPQEHATPWWKSYCEEGGGFSLGYGVDFLSIFVDGGASACCICGSRFVGTPSFFVCPRFNYVYFTYIYCSNVLRV
ncbi:hypothetical protein C8R44DRAFT_976966, partial [Mycena epipterygia]